jgi:type II secretory ATPase GspE/PulE/Tfp pilus assembly ATPase PilB-like protein
MSEDSLDIYIKSLILEAARLESREIQIKQGEGRPEISFHVHGETIPFPHPPKQASEQLMPRLRSMAKLPERPTSSEEHAKASVKRRNEPIELQMTFCNDSTGSKATIEILSDVSA